MSSSVPTPRSVRKKIHKPWSRGFFMQRGPEINGSYLYYTTSSTQGFMMPLDRGDVMAALEPKKEEAKA